MFLISLYSFCLCFSCFLSSVSVHPVPLLPKLSFNHFTQVICSFFLPSLPFLLLTFYLISSYLILLQLVPTLFLSPPPSLSLSIFAPLFLTSAPFPSRLHLLSFLSPKLFSTFFQHGPHISTSHLSSSLCSLLSYSPLSSPFPFNPPLLFSPLNSSSGIYLFLSLTLLSPHLPSPPPPSFSSTSLLSPLPTLRTMCPLFP